MTEQNTWSPWFDHVPGPCPVPVGTTIQIEAFMRRTGKIASGVILITPEEFVHHAWLCRPDCVGEILRYRYRISPAFEQLRQLAETPADLVTA